MALIYTIPRGSLQSELMSLDYDSALISAEYFDAGGLPVTPTVAATLTYRKLPGSPIVGVAQQQAGIWQIEGPVLQVFVSLTGTGATTAKITIWRSDNAGSGVPDGAFVGLRAMTFQNYIEANAKLGVQYEVASNTPALGVGANIDTIFITGANPVVVKSRIVKFNGGSLLTRVFTGATYTGGSPVTYFNLNDRNPVAGTVTIISGATVTGTGAEFGAPTYDIGSTDIGNSSISTFSTFGIERILKPNTIYLQRITNDSAAVQRVSGYLTWYDGSTDLPIRAS
ncbi:hypothetical protein D3C85_281160 [compost metagenome]